MEISKIVRKGLFLNLEEYEKTKFIKNPLFYKILENDVVKYVMKGDKVMVIKIMEREPVSTIGIVKSYDEKEEEYVFYTPL